MVSSLFKKYIWAVIVVLFLVILAGSIVRVTQSGMGCPDWPTCFGQAIPPTQEWQVHFQPNHAYKKGQFIIENDSLKYALEKFTSSKSYQSTDWKQYEKHNNASFQVSQTWIEYINRLLGVLLVLLISGQCIWCFFYWNKNRGIVLLGVCLVLLSAYQAWLGKTVVDSNLAALKISLHLAGALAMVFVEIGLLYYATGKQKIAVKTSVKWIAGLLGIAVLIQMVVGTQVRGQIDLIAEKAGFIDRSGWVSQLNFYFYFHRSFALLVGAMAALLYWQTYKNPLVKKLSKYAISCIAAEILLGAIFVFGGFPAIAQPIHLLISTILIAVVFNIWLKTKVDMDHIQNTI